MKERNPNLYERLGTNRLATTDFLNERLDQALVCEAEATEQACANFTFSSGQQLNMTEIRQIRFVLVNKPQLRELYDKTEIFIRPRLEKSYHNPAPGKRYLSALGDLSYFAMYVLYLVFTIEKY